MFKKKFIIADVVSCHVDGDLVYLSKNTEADKSAIFVLSISNNKLLLQKSTDVLVENILFKEDKLLLIERNGMGSICEKSSLKLQEKIPISLKIASMDGFMNYLVVYRGKVKNREFGVYSLKDKELIWSSNEQKGLTLVGGKLFGRNTGYIIYHSDLYSSRLLWELDLKNRFASLVDKLGFVQILGTANDFLILGIECIDKLIAVNIKSGTIEWERTTGSGLFKIDKKRNELHVISGGYKCLDASTGLEMDSFDNRAYFDEIGILSQRNNFAILDKYIITTDYRKGVIGAFNTSTHQFDWVHEEEGVSFPAGNPIEYSDPYLLLHDNKGTLHVFEKE